MSADDFFSRWSRRRQEATSEPAQASAPAAAPAPPEDLPPPTLDDVAGLTHDADFRRFVAPGVDETVRRSAMKKLFTDPHFNVMDGLDIYIDDYNKFEPLPAAMLAMLLHAKPLLDPLGHLQKPAMRLLDLEPAAEPASPGGGAPEQALPAAADEPLQEQAGAEPDAAAASPGELPAGDTETRVTPADASQPLPDPAAPQDDHTI